VLPARREDVELSTRDGLTLVGELSSPLERPAVATLVCLHPLPTHGGSMDSHLLKKASNLLPHLAGVAVLRLNTRGTSSMRGTSQGVFGDGEDEGNDVAAALSLVESERLPDPWLLGWSFGSDLVLRYGLSPVVRGAVLLSPTLRWSTPEHLEPWAAAGTPLTVLLPEHDDFLSTQQALERFRVVPQAEVVVIEGAKHLLFGGAERVFAEVLQRVVPEAVTVVGTS
jgi:alpha/beta superfamily hydrolase